MSSAAGKANGRTDDSVGLGAAGSADTSTVTGSASLLVKTDATVVGADASVEAAAVDDAVGTGGCGCGEGARSSNSATDLKSDGKDEEEDEDETDEDETADDGTEPVPSDAGLAAGKALAAVATVASAASTRERVAALNGSVGEGEDKDIDAGVSGVSGF
jgi:hypothetical protein